MVELVVRETLRQILKKCVFVEVSFNKYQVKYKFTYFVFSNDVIANLVFHVIYSLYRHAHRWINLPTY
jgi:hypothetical protein